MLNTDPETLARLAFSYAPGVGPVTFHKLISHFGSAQKAYNSHDHEVGACISNSQTRESFMAFRKSFSAHSTISALFTNDIHYIPYSLLEGTMRVGLFSTNLIGLFLHGDASLLTSDTPTLAIVGSRKPTQYGIQTAELFASTLARDGAIILSGLAIGIDSQAHQSCIDAGGKTIAVLGTGHPAPTARASLRLYRAIIDSGGLVVSEYPPDTPAHKGAFPARNRIIAGLSDGIILVEGAEHSGSRITAQHALNIGKELFCIPGSIFSPQSHTPHDFIQQGAHLTQSVEDIYSILRMRPVPTRTPLENALFALIQKTAITAQTIIQLLNKPSDIIIHQLTQLEAQGYIFKQPDGKYSARP